MQRVEAPHHEVSHRNHPLRAVQSRFEGKVPDLLLWMHGHGMLERTQIDKVLSESGQLHPDDVTMSNLQMTVDSALGIVTDGATRSHVTRALTGWSLDGLDGALARLLGVASTDGAIKDAAADRIGELYIVKLISDELSAAGRASYDRSSDYMAAMQLSTLTKAACEMCGVPTGEGGMGSMIERRRILLFTLVNVGKLRHTRDEWEKSRLAAKIEQDMTALVHKSTTRAVARASTLYNWNNPALLDPTTSAAAEARKYATIILMNRRLHVDMVKRLNSLTPKAKFPSPEELIKKYPYIAESVNSTESFISRALAIAGFKE